jgi:endonuclease YncB( thermonuclease family)
VVAPVFPHVVSRFVVRLDGIDTPELRTKDEWEKKAAKVVRHLVEQRILNDIIEFVEIGHDKYGRLLSKVQHNGESLNDWLIAQGWAAPYDGQGAKLSKKMDWESKVSEYLRSDPDFEF